MVKKEVEKRDRLPIEQHPEYETLKKYFRDLFEKKVSELKQQTKAQLKVPIENHPDYHRLMDKYACKSGDQYVPCSNKIKQAIKKAIKQCKSPTPPSKDVMELRMLQGVTTTPPPHGKGVATPTPISPIGKGVMATPPACEVENCSDDMSDETNCQQWNNQRNIQPQQTNRVQQQRNMQPQQQHTMAREYWNSQFS